ncbi:atrophin-1-like [Varroa jacobsoni]|uniref:atrophin-1-like n=1 Tax=Varroa jacobsoni TaxID=62625 RepID=UPI000BFA0A62|nr:atrophin-1-like [Varroa jacobsoni]
MGAQHGRHAKDGVADEDENRGFEGELRDERRQRFIAARRTLFDAEIVVVTNASNSIISIVGSRSTPSPASDVTGGALSSSPPSSAKSGAPPPPVAATTASLVAFGSPLSPGSAPFGRSGRALASSAPPSLGLFGQDLPPALRQGLGLDSPLAMATLGPLASALGPLGASLASMAPATTASQTTGTGSHTPSQTGSGRSSPDDALNSLRTPLSPLGGSPAASPSPQPPLGLPSLSSPLSSPLSSTLASLPPAVLHQMHQSLLHGPMPLQPQTSAEHREREHHHHHQPHQHHHHHQHNREQRERDRERERELHRERLGGAAAVGALGALTQLRLQASLSPPSGLTANGHGGHHGASGVNGGHHVLNGNTTGSHHQQQHALKFNEPKLPCAVNN